MKIVHEISGAVVQTGGGGVRPYFTEAGTVPVDGYVDQIVVVVMDEQHKEKEVMYLEGTLSSMHELFTQLLSLIDVCADIEVERGRLDPEWKTKGSKLE